MLESSPSPAKQDSSPDLDSRLAGLVAALTIADVIPTKSDKVGAPKDVIRH